MFDSLKYAKILEEAGIPRSHAETHIRVLGDVVGEEMVTKQDLRENLASFKNELKAEIRSDLVIMGSELRANIKEAIDKSEQRMIIKMGSMMAGFLTLGLALSQLL